MEVCKNELRKSQKLKNLGNDQTNQHFKLQSRFATKNEPK